MGPDHYCVSYFLRGRDLINVVLRGKSEEWAEESWTAQDDPEAVRVSEENAALWLAEARAARGVPPDVNALVARLTHPDPQQRPASADEVLRQLALIG